MKDDCEADEFISVVSRLDRARKLRVLAVMVKLISEAEGRGPLSGCAHDQAPAEGQKPQ